MIKLENCQNSPLYRALLIDDREPPIIAEKIAEKCSVEISFQRLDEGDFVSSDGKVLIQRKEVNDLCMSIVDGRLFGKDGKEGQIQRMTQNADKCYLLVHGYLENVPAKMHHSVIGALCKICSQFDIKVLWVNDEDSMVYAILKVMEWEGKLELLKPKRKKPVPEAHEPDFFVGEVKME